MRPPIAVLEATVPVLLLSLAVGCSDGDGDDRSGNPSDSPSESPASTRPADVVSAELLDGTTYVSTNVTGHDLVEGSEVQLSFADGVMTASAGCNTIFGAYEVEESLLRWTGPPAATLIGCPEDLDAQDQWLTTLLTDGVPAALQERTLTLTAGDVTLELAAETPPDLDTVLGRTWTLVGRIADGATSRLPRDIHRPFLSVRADGLARLNTGCNVGRTTVRPDGEQLVFGHATTTRRACCGPARLVEQDLLAIVDQQRTDHVELRDRLLILTRAESGLVFSLNRPPDDGPVSRSQTQKVT